MRWTTIGALAGSLALASALAGCASAPPQDPALVRRQAPPRPTPENVVRRLLERTPAHMRWLGFHDFDGRVADYGEAGLREAEASLTPVPAFPAAGCVNGLCARPVPTDRERWAPDSGFDAWRTASVSDPNTAAPRYIVEEMGEGPNWRDCDRLSPIHPLCLTPRYRVTVLSQQAGRASVTLQTIFAGR